MYIITFDYIQVIYYCSQLFVFFTPLILIHLSIKRKLFTLIIYIKMYKLIGRTTDFKGKTLWEILGNLKKFGVCRAVSRNMFQRYPESTYIKILKVEALSDVEPSFEVSIFSYLIHFIN
jgi:hypothetical protein